MNTAQLLILFAFFGVSCLRAEPAPLLVEALKKNAAERGRWAFTETRTRRDEAGKVEERVVRVDPSKPYAQQFTPLSLNGKPPSEKLVNSCREYGERNARARHEQLEKAEKNPPVGARSPTFSLGNKKASFDMERAYVVEENATWVRYRVPLIAEGKAREVFEKTELTLLVSKEHGHLEEVRAELQEATRLNIMKAQPFMISWLYTVVDPAHPPIMTAIKNRFKTGAKEQFRTEEIAYSDFKRVKPYDERFKAKGGEISVFEL